MVDASFAKISERCFRGGAAWPPAPAVSHLVGGDAVFLLLYSELTFRHLHASCAPTLADRAASWANYEDLFNVLLSAPLNVQLPPAWMADIVDEFVYQFQAFHQARARAAARRAAGKAGAPSTAPATTAAKEAAQAELASVAGAWPAARVLTYLHLLSTVSGVAADLAAPGGPEAFDAEAGAPPNRAGGSNALRMVGYFALVGLCRAHCLVGDYEGALAALGPGLNPAAAARPGGPPLATRRLAGCHIALHYHAGFAALMARRPADAVVALGAGLAYIARVKQVHQRSAAYDQILKKNEQCHALLALALAACPAAAASLSDGVAAALREKHGDKVDRMVRAAGDAAYEDLFSYGCPKFVPASVGPADADAAAAAAEAAAGAGEGAGADSVEAVAPPASATQAAYRQQLRAFLAGVAARATTPPVAALLRIYTTAAVPKLASLLDTPPAEARAALLALRSSGAQRLWGPGVGDGSPAAGTPSVVSDLDFELGVDPATGEEVVTVTAVRGGSSAAGVGGGGGDMAAASLSAADAQAALVRGVKELAAVTEALRATAPAAVVA